MVSVTNNNEFATTENGEPTATGNKSIWYEWTAPASGQLTLTTEGSDNFNQYLTVWIGNSVSTVKSVVSVGPATFPSVEFPVAAGTVYYICSGSYSSGYGTIQLNLTLNTSSSLDTLTIIGAGTTTNDNFADRIITSTEFGSFIAYNGSATREALEPTPGNATMWWTYHAPANGVLDINDLGDGTWAYNKYISVWSGTAVQNLELLVPEILNTGGDCFIPVIQGNDYQICISGYSSGTGPYVLTFSLNVNSDLNSFDLSGGATFTNDNFNSATVLNGATPAAVSYNSYATRQALEPSDGNNTLWFVWTAPASGLTQILAPEISQLNGSDNFNKYITAYTGTTINTLTQVGQVGPTSYPQLNLTAVAGQTYYIAVGSYSSGSGPFAFGIFGQPGTPTGPTLPIGQAYKIQFPTVTNTTYRIQESSNLSVWNTLTNVVSGNGLLQKVFVDPQGANNLLFRATAQ